MRYVPVWQYMSHPWLVGTRGVSAGRQLLIGGAECLRVRRVPGRVVLPDGGGGERRERVRGGQQRMLGSHGHVGAATVPCRYHTHVHEKQSSQIFRTVFYGIITFPLFVLQVSFARPTRRSP